MMHSFGIGRSRRDGERASARTGKISKWTLGLLLAGAVSAVALGGSARAEDEKETPPSTQPTAGGGGGGGDDYSGGLYAGGTGGGGGGGGGALGGGGSDPEAQALAGGTGGVGGGGGGGGGSISDSYDLAPAVSSVPVPAAVWAGMAMASGIGVWAKTRKRKA
jgi:hypothetical protein